MEETLVLRIRHIGDVVAMNAWERNGNIPNPVSLKICICLKGDTSDNFYTMIYFVSRMTNLKSLEIFHDGEAMDGTLSYASMWEITRAIEPLRRLENLKIGYNIKLYGRKQYFEDFGNVLSQLPLNSLSFHCCWMTTGPEPYDMPPFRPVFWAIPMIQSLHIVSFTKKETGDLETEPSQEEIESYFRAILELPELDGFIVDGLVKSDKILKTLSQAAAKNESLGTLMSPCHELGKTGSSALSKLVLTTRNMSTLLLTVWSFHSRANSKDIVQEILLSVGKSKLAEFYLALFVDKDLLADLLPCALCTLKAALLHNYTLKQVTVKQCGESSVNDEEIDFLLEMNRLGRGELVRSAYKPEGCNRGGWMKMFEAAGDDLTKLYCLLRYNHHFLFEN